MDICCAKGSRPQKDKKKNPQKIAAILEGALEEFGKNGFEAATIAAICKAANVSDATLYEYFKSKEDVLFSIPELYTRRELEHLREVSRYIHGAREKIRLIIQAYLEFYEKNPLYTSVVLLTLKGNRKFSDTPAYRHTQEASTTIIQAYNEGVEEGVFREDLDGGLVRNMILGFIENITIQWLLTGRPENISAYRDTIFNMVIRAIENTKKENVLELKLTIEGLGKNDIARIS